MSGSVTVLMVAYDGRAFHGFARQDGPRTVQGELERALTTALRRPVTVTGAGRTDTGVHALGQVVSFDAAPGDPDDATIARSVGALAGRDVAVRDVRHAREGFSARHDATAREYRYLLSAGPVPPVLTRGRVWWVRDRLDAEAMRQGAAHLLGEHDFRSFCVSESADRTRTVRDISALDIAEVEVLGERCLEVRIVGRSFLHSMVRIVVGSLVEVGRGRRGPAWVGEALAACSRAAAGPTAPPDGLVLWGVTYPDEVWR